jgi:aspartyl protease family protein
MQDLPRSLKITTVWLLLGLVLFVAVLAWQKRQQAMQFSVNAGVIEIRRSADGHYHWPAELNGQRIDFLIDTGATGTAIPAALAQQLGLRGEGAVQSQTAGGVAIGKVVVADLALQGGVRAERLRLVALPGLASPLLGMDVLGRLRWQQSDGRLRIEADAGLR